MHFSKEDYNIEENGVSYTYYQKNGNLYYNSIKQKTEIQDRKKIKTTNYAKDGSVLKTLNI